MKIIVSDASPLIGLARINRLTLLKDIFSTVIIPPEVRNELRIGSGKPGEKILAFRALMTLLNVSFTFKKNHHTAEELAPLQCDNSNNRIRF